MKGWKAKTKKDQKKKKRDKVNKGGSLDAFDVVTHTAESDHIYHSESNDEGVKMKKILFCIAVLHDIKWFVAENTK